MVEGRRLPAFLFWLGCLLVVVSCSSLLVGAVNAQDATSTDGSLEESKYGDALPAATEILNRDLAIEPGEPKPELSWSWYWDRKAQLNVVRHKRFYEDDIGGKALEAFRNDVFVPSWNGLMQHDLVRAGLLVLLTGGLFKLGSIMASGLFDFEKKPESVELGLDEKERRLEDLVSQSQAYSEQMRAEFAQWMEGLKQAEGNASSLVDTDPLREKWLLEAQKDPKNSLILFRVALEERVKKLSLAFDEKAEKRNLVDLIDELEKRGVIADLGKTFLQAIRPVLNSAVHAQGVKDEDLMFCLYTAPAVLSWLDRKIEEIKHLP